MVTKLPKNRRVVEDVCRRLGSSGAEKKLAVQNCRRLGNHRGIRLQILQKLKKCNIYEKMIL